MWTKILVGIGPGMGIDSGTTLCIEDFIEYEILSGLAIEPSIRSRIADG